MTINHYSLGEKFDFHPLVRYWLEANGYTYDYEVKMPEYGRADFLANHPEGYTLIVECKVNKAATLPSSIDQLLNYQHQLPSSRAAYAIPSDLVTEAISDLCHTHDILLILIDIPDELKVPSQVKERKAQPSRLDYRPPRHPDVERLFLMLYRDFQKRSLSKLQQRVISGYRSRILWQSPSSILKVHALSR